MRNQPPHTFWIFTQRTQFLADGLLQVGNRIPQHIADPIFYHVADGFRRIEFRTIGRQRHQMHMLRHNVQFWLGVKPGLIPDDHMFGSRVAPCQMLQKQVAHLQTHFRQAQKLRRILTVYFQRRVEVAPFIFGSIRHGRTHASQRPALAHYRNQTVTVFIGHPQAYRSSTSYVQVRQLFAKRLLELFGGSRVFLRVGLARHFQDPAQFSQPVIHPG
jgi:hypothetical protein